MKFVSSLLLSALTLISCAHASPIAAVNEQPLLVNTHLAARTLRYPVQSSDALVANIMASVQADLYAKVFGSITSTFCEKTGASISAKASMLGGLITGDAHLQTIQSAAVKNLKVSFDAELRAQVQAKICDKLQINLQKSLGISIMDQVKFLAILEEFEAQAKAMIKVQLPKIGVDLTLKAKDQIDAAINDVQVNLPWVAQVTISVGVNVKTTIDATIKTALIASAKLDAKASALAILKSL